jgi:ATP-binding cassette, subfamily B, bacterial MsbA
MPAPDTTATPAAKLDALLTYRRLLSYLRKYRGMFSLAVLGACIFALTQAAYGWLTKKFIDGTFLDQDHRMLMFVPVGLVLLFAVRGLGDFMQSYFMGQVGRRIVRDLRNQVFDHLLRMPIAYFDGNASAVLLSRLTYNTEQVAQATTDSGIGIVRETVTIIGTLAWLFYLNPRLTWFALIAAPLIAWLISVANKSFRRYSRRIQNSMGDVTRVAKDALESPRVIKVFNAQDYQSSQFEIATERNRRSNMKLVFAKSLSNPVVQIIAAAGVSSVLYLATQDALQGRLTTAEFMSFIVSLATISQPLRNLVNVAGPLQQGIAAGQSLFELLDEPIEADIGTRSVERVRGDVEYRNVSFSYVSGKRAGVDEISLQARAGDIIAIVGKSGSGKSTLVNLLPRFYDVKSGAVMVDGVDVRDYQLRNLRDQVAVVSQEIVLFNDTIRANIAFGREASAGAIEEAARTAHVREFVAALPEGLETVVGDRGVMLSGGQRQRIAIARALLKNAPILILDEAMSALDTESERAIQGALEELMHNRTTFVIAHRLSTVESATRILVMDAGRIVETGTHAELVAHSGIYATLHRMQFAL